MKSSHGGVPYLTLPIQWGLLGHNLLITANFITALLVPWVEANYLLADMFFPIYVPVVSTRSGEL